MNVLGLGIVISLLVNASGLAFDIAMGCCLCQPTPVELFVPLCDRGILRVFRWKLELGNRQGQVVHRNDPTPGSNSVMLWGRVFLEESRKTSIALSELSMGCVDRLTVRAVNAACLTGLRLFTIAERHAGINSMAIEWLLYQNATSQVRPAPF
jgi:hypothetical protein